MRTCLLVFVLAGLITACSDNGEKEDQSAPSGESAQETQSQGADGPDLEAGGPVDEPVPEKPEKSKSEQKSAGDQGGDESAQDEQSSADADKASSGDGSSEGKDSARAPEAIYEDYCVACHEQGMAGAPKLAATKDWQSRVDQRGLDGLVSNSIDGYRAMPAKGTCMDCSNEELRATVKWMLDEAGVSL